MARRSVAAFLEQFALPLVRGGELRVSEPITFADLRRFEDDLPHASEALVAVDEARTEVVSTLVVRPPALVLDAEALHLCAAVHNLLFLVHPDADGLMVTRRARAKVLETARQMAARPLTVHRRRILARHGVLHNLFDVTRMDTKIIWWTGSADFLGQQPPKRLVAWRTLRRVREETQIAAYEELLASVEAAPVIATLLRRSPLTHVLASHPQAPPLHWEDAVFLLRDAELARAIAYMALRPTDPTAVTEAPARYAAAFEQMLERTPAPADVRAVAAFLVHLSALLALGEVRQRDRKAKSPILATVLAPDRAGQRPRGLVTFLALPNALAQVAPELAQPPGLGSDPHLLQRWEIHRKQVAEDVGSAVIETLAARLERRLAPIEALAIREPADIDRL